MQTHLLQNGKLPLHIIQLDYLVDGLLFPEKVIKWQKLQDLKKKIRLIDELVSISTKSDTRLWITETNWPLLNTQPFTPNSGHPRSTVNEQTQAKYLTDYYQIAWRTGRVERVYWWQLIQAGYGLVDHRANKLRKMPSYLAFKELCSSKDWVNQTL